MLTFDAIVRYRQRHRRLTLSVHFNVQLSENRFPVLFEPFAIKHPYEDTFEYEFISYKQADEGVVNFLKYFANYLFYRFGLEVIEIRKIQLIEYFSPSLDLLHNIGHRYWRSDGYLGSVRCCLARIISCSISTNYSTYLANICSLLYDYVSIALYECHWCTTVSLF